MFWLWFLLAAAQCVLLYILARAGRGLAQRAREDAAASLDMAEEDWPVAAMIIPVAGSHPRMADALKSLLSQDYPRLLPVLVTAEAEEPAAGLIRSLLKDFPAARHVVAGRAQGCGQKNHNSLRGVAAVAHEAEIYLFCDSTHLARPDFARALAAPIVRGEAAFSTGYHMVDARDEKPVTLAYACCVLLMRLLQAVSSFTQLWGGAMAMSKSAFEHYGVAELWARNVVDDCSLSALLQARKTRVRLCPGALLRTEALDHSLPVWRAWMSRQVLFLKFCMPGQWLLLGLMALIMAVPPLCAAVALLGGLLNLGGGSGVFLSLAWLGALAGALNIWRNFLAPPRPAFWRWLLAFFYAAGMFAWVYCRSIRARGIVWHGIAYEVGLGGTVLHAGRA